MMNNGFSSRDDIYTSRATMCFDNKAMVTTVPPVASTAPQRDTRLNIQEHEKNTTEPSLPSRIRIRRRIRLPSAINAVLAILVTSLIILLELGYIPGTKLGFYCKDPSLSYHYNGDTITSTTLLVGSLIIYPLGVFFFTDYLRAKSTARISFRSVWDIYKEFITGCALVLLITEIAKVLIGEHRPYFFEICKPNTAENCTSGEYVYTYECTETSRYSHYFLSDTSRSFPSGHSSLSVFVALFCSYIIQVRLPTIQTGNLFKPFFISVCLTWALVCSLSRISDKRHHWWDVGAGMVTGACGALYSISIIRKNELSESSIPRVAMSTTTLLDVKNKDAKSQII